MFSWSAKRVLRKLCTDMWVFKNYIFNTRLTDGFPMGNIWNSTEFIFKKYPMFCWRLFLIHWKPNPSPNSHKTEQLSTLSQVLTDTTSSDKTRNENGQISNKKKTSIVFLKSQSPAPKTSLSRLHCACVISISSPDQFRLKKTRCQFYFYKKKLK